MRGWLLLALLPALAQDVPSAPADAPPVEAPAAPVEAPAAPVEAPTASEGEAALAEAIALLAAGEYEKALSASILATSRYPELAPSFRTVAEVAADQLERRRTGSSAATTAAVPPPQPVVGLPRPYSYRPASRAPRRITRLVGGFEVGLPSAFRVELDTDAKRAGGVDGVGVRFGGNTLLYRDVWPVSDLSVYLDFRVNETWQLEASAGGFTYFGFMYPMAGAAVQYDPEGPLFVNGGARVGPYGSWLPDASVGFVW